MANAYVSNQKNASVLFLDTFLYIIIYLLETDCSLEELESHSCNFPDVVMVIEHRQARDYHVSVPDGLHLQNVARVTLTILQPTLPKLKKKSVRVYILQLSMFFNLTTLLSIFLAVYPIDGRKSIWKFLHTI